MNKSLKNLWVAALTSGYYKQGTGYLKRHRGGKTEYCCLGVLCQVAGVPEDSRTTISKFGGFDDTLSTSLRATLRLSSSDTLKLANMNDGCRQSPGGLRLAPRKTFKQIARWIKENL